MPPISRVVNPITNHEAYNIFKRNFISYHTSDYNTVLTVAHVPKKFHVNFKLRYTIPHNNENIIICTCIPTLTEHTPHTHTHTHTHTPTTTCF